MVKKEIENIVNKLLDKGLSGVEFFDELDEHIVNNISIIKGLLYLVPENSGIVLSGGFGRKVSQLIESGSLPKINYILFNGGIRSGKEPEILIDNLGDKTDLYFLDDTIYGGKTYKDILDYLNPEKLVKSVYVVYDGAPVERDWVNSLFRYYDYFESKPNFKF